VFGDQFFHLGMVFLSRLSANRKPSASATGLVLRRQVVRKSNTEEIRVSRLLIEFLLTGLVLEPAPSPMTNFNSTSELI
jgi:hypothetical protein